MRCGEMEWNPGCRQRSTRSPRVPMSASGLDTGSRADSVVNDNADSTMVASFASRSRTLQGEDRVTLNSVGVDIGSATTHVMFSALTLERSNTRYVITDRRTLYCSPVELTPYVSGELIDAERLSRLIDSHYQAASLSPEDVDTGVLILTGTAALQRNARSIGTAVAGEAGKFVAMSAGDNLESILGAHGSGAVARSLGGRRVLHVDIGGGTTKLSLCDDGTVQQVAALDVGARLVVLDKQRTVIRFERTVDALCTQLGLTVEIGSTFTAEDSQRLCAAMIDHVSAAMSGGTPVGSPVSLMRTGPLRDASDIDEIALSGGVSEYFYGVESQTFGDLGPGLAAAFADRLSTRGISVAPRGGGIRATVLGASQFGVQVSGATIYLTDADGESVKNLRVIVPRFDLSGDVVVEAATQAVSEALSRLDLLDGSAPVAVFVRWAGSASYDRLRAFCAGVVAGLEPVIANGYPIVLIADQDVGGVIGLHLRQHAETTTVVSIDGIDVGELDFVDIGELIDGAGAVPVTIKSLAFPSRAKEQA